MSSMFIDIVKDVAKATLVKVLAVVPSADLTGRKGGYACVKRLGDDGLLAKPILVGEVTNGKDDKYIDFCQEKANRLLVEHVANGHFSSFQSQDPDHQKWPGAILGHDNEGGKYAFSFSGLPWMCDEAIMLMTAIEVGYLKQDEAIAIAAISDNKVFFDATGYDSHS